MACMLAIESTAQPFDPFEEAESRRPIRHCNTDHGLPQNFILAIAQTPDDALWIGTGTALARFDGTSFSHFDRVNTPALPSIDILRLYVDRRNALWIKTAAGVLRRTVDGVFENRNQGLEGFDPNRFFEDRSGQLWLWSRSGELRVFREPRWHRPRPTSFEGQPESIFLTDAEGFVFQFADGRVLPLSFANGDPAQALDPIFWSRDEELWLSQEDRVDSYSIDPRSQKLHLRSSMAFPGTPTAILQTLAGEIWVGLRGLGLYQLQGNSLSLRQESSEVSVLLEDHEGGIWAGTYGDGLIHVKPKPRFTAFTAADGLSHNEVRTIVEDRDALWVATSKGLDRLSAGGIRCFDADSVGIGAQSLALSSTGALWSGNNRVSRWNGDSFEWIYRDRIEGAQGQILPTHSGGLWIASEHLHYVLESSDQPALTLPVENVRGLHIDRQDRLWIATIDTGLWTYDRGELRRFWTDPDPPLFAGFFEEDDGTLWVTSRESGIFRIEDHGLQAVDSARGLFDATIHHIIDDRLGGYWLTSDRGIARVDRENLRAVADGAADRLDLQVFGKDDGLPSIECNSGFPGPARLRDGRLVFPTMKGLAIVDPAQPAASQPPPKVEISRVLVEHAPVDPSPELFLQPDQRSIAIEYAAMVFAAPQSLRFRYQLQGFDADWIDAQSRRTAFYTRLPPGDYLFRVQAKAHGSDWSSRDATLKLHLSPRFQETRTFTALVLVLAMLLIWAYGRWRRSAIYKQELEALVAKRTRSLEQEKRRTQEQAEKLQELGRLKNRFFANISHELRTPLTLLTAPLQASRDTAKPIRADTLDIMRRSAERLEGRIDELLDLSKLEAGQVPLSCRRRDLIEFCRERLPIFESLAGSRGLSLQLEAETDQAVLYFDLESFEKIFDNLMSNAIKYSSPGGRITVRIQRGRSARTVLWTVEDEGIGIEEQELERIFQRFHRIETGQDRPGTGLGLALVKELVERHGGTISAAGKPGQGSCFTVELREGQDHLRSEDLSPASNPLAAAAPYPPWPATPESPVREATLAPQEITGAPAERAVSPAQPSPVAGTVLLAEDDPDMRTYLRGLLAERFAVIEACDGRDASELASATIPDLVLTDIAMPQADGFTLAQELRNDQKTDHIPIVFLTACGSVDSRVEGFKTGIDAYLTKPFSPQELMACIESLLSNRERLRIRFEKKISLESQIVDAEPQTVRFLKRVLEIAEQRISDQGFGVFELAEDLGLSRRQLNRKLSALTDEGPSSLIRRLRLERAHQLLKARTGTVGEIAAAVGFAKPSHFSKVFREAYGTPPSSLLSPPRSAPSKSTDLTSRP